MNNSSGSNDRSDVNWTYCKELTDLAFFIAVKDLDGRSDGVQLAAIASMVPHRRQTNIEIPSAPPLLQRQRRVGDSPRVIKLDGQVDDSDQRRFTDERLNRSRHPSPVTSRLCACVSTAPCCGTSTSGPGPSRLGPFSRMQRRNICTVLIRPRTTSAYIYTIARRCHSNEQMHDGIGLTLPVVVYIAIAVRTASRSEYTTRSRGRVAMTTIATNVDGLTTYSLRQENGFSRNASVVDDLNILPKR